MDMKVSDFVSDEAALRWANELFPDHKPTLIREFPWARLFRLEASSGIAFLKMLPLRQRHDTIFQRALSRQFAPAIPEVLAVNEELGLALFNHHGGVDLHGGPGFTQRAHLLATYADLQARARNLPDLLGTLPAVHADDVLDRFIDFLKPQDDSGRSATRTVKAGFFLGADESMEYHDVFMARRDMLRAFIADAAALPPTLNHGDLRYNNAAEADDGSTIIYDWDDACVGPAGMSLQAYFKGCFRVLQYCGPRPLGYADYVKVGSLTTNPAVLQQQQVRFEGARSQLDVYIDALAAGGYASADELRRSLPASVCIGAMQALLKFADYGLGDDHFNADINEYFVKRLDDLLDLCDHLASTNRRNALAFAQDYIERGIDFRAGYIYRRFVNSHPNDSEILKLLAPLLLRAGKNEEAIERYNTIVVRCPDDVRAFNELGLALLKVENLEQAITKFELALSIDPRFKEAARHRDRCQELLSMISEAQHPNKLPPVRVSDGEREDGHLSVDKTRVARSLFKKHGALALEGVFEVELLTQIKRLILEKYNAYFEPREYDDCLRLGDKRHMVTLGLEGPLASPDLYDNPYLKSIIGQALGKDYILGAVNIGVSLPGSRNQAVHKDYPPLFEEDEAFRDNTPCFALGVLIPLVQHSHAVGTTLVIKDSHRLDNVAARALPGQAPFLDIGGCLMIDYRVGHQGLANFSEDVVRPLLTLVYHRCWFRDCVNYAKQPPIRIDTDAFEAAPDRLKELIGWARSESIISTVQY